MQFEPYYEPEPEEPEPEEPDPECSCHPRHS